MAEERASGELIRCMNYVEDCAATLRRVEASLPLLSDSEKARLLEFTKQTTPNTITLLAKLGLPGD